MLLTRHVSQLAAICRITYIVLVQTLNHAQSINQLAAFHTDIRALG